MNAVIYCRVSSKEQVEGTSLESQERACRDYAQRNGLNVVQVFVDRGESAKFADRPQLLEMLAFCKNKGNRIQQMLVWKVDRLARNVGDHFSIKASLMKHDVRVVSVTEPIDAKPEGRLLETILAGFAQFDNDVRAARTVQGMRSKLREGIFPWQPPVGYKGAEPPGNKKTKPDVPDQPAFSIIQRAWLEFAGGGLSKAEVVRFLGREGVRTFRGCAPTHQGIDALFRNPFYMGVLVDPWSGEEFPGHHIPMVSPETFNAVQVIIAGRNRSIPHIAVRPEFPLRGLARCTQCRSKLTASFSRGGSGGRYAYYHCNNRKCDTPSSYPLERLHQEFAQFLNETSPDAHAITHLKDAIIETASNWKQVKDRFREKQEHEAQRAQEQLRELIRMKMDRLVTDDEFVEQRRVLESRISTPRAVQSEMTLNADVILNDLNAISDRLMDLAGAWRDTALRFQRKFQHILLPDGFFVGEIGTAKRGQLFSFFESPLPANATGVPLTCERWNGIAADIREFAEIFSVSM